MSSVFLSFLITSSHDFLGLPALFCATTFSLRTSTIQPVLRSTCPKHLILPMRSTTSKSWMPSFERRESELTSSFAMTLQIQQIMARSLHRRRFSVSASMALNPKFQVSSHLLWLHSLVWFKPGRNPKYMLFHDIMITYPCNLHSSHLSFI